MTLQILWETCIYSSRNFWTLCVAAHNIPMFSDTISPALSDADTSRTSTSDILKHKSNCCALRGHRLEEIKSRVLLYLDHLIMSRAVILCRGVLWRALCSKDFCGTCVWLLSLGILDDAEGAFSTWSTSMWSGLACCSGDLWTPYGVQIWCFHILGFRKSMRFVVPAYMILLRSWTGKWDISMLLATVMNTSIRAEGHLQILSNAIVGLLVLNSTVLHLG